VYLQKEFHHSLIVIEYLAKYEGEVTIPCCYSMLLISIHMRESCNDNFSFSTRVNMHLNSVKLDNSCLVMCRDFIGSLVHGLGNIK